MFWAIILSTVGAQVGLQVCPGIVVVGGFLVEFHLSALSDKKYELAKSGVTLCGHSPPTFMEACVCKVCTGFD